MMARAAGFAFLLLLTGACAPPTGGPSGGPPDEPPYIDGTITTLNTGADGAFILVEEAGDGGNQAAVTVTADTIVVQEFGGGYEPANYTHLRQGQHVAVWTTSPVRESFPVQVTPSGIVIRER